MIHAHQRAAEIPMLANAMMVTPTEVIEGGTVVVTDGIVTDILDWS